MRGLGGEAEAPTRTRAISPLLTEPQTLPDCCKWEEEELKSPWGLGLDVDHVWGLEQGDVKTPALASAPIRVDSTAASAGARGSLVGTPGTHNLALSTPLQTLRTSSEIHPQRGEALGMGWDLMGKGGVVPGHVQCALADASVLGVGSIH